MWWLHYRKPSRGKKDRLRHGAPQLGKPFRSLAKTEKRGMKVKVRENKMIPYYENDPAQ